MCGASLTLSTFSSAHCRSSWPSMSQSVPLPSRLAVSRNSSMDGTLAPASTSSLLGKEGAGWGGLNG